MLKLGEKIIYEISSGFELIGINKALLDEFKLSITNLGKIIIRRNNESLKNSEKEYVYDCIKNKNKLILQIKNNKLIAVGENLLFNTNKLITLKIEMSIIDLNEIYKRQRDFIFEINGNNTIMQLDKNDEFYLANIQLENNRIIVIGEELEETNINLNDVEEYHIDTKKIRLKGYFYIKDKKHVAREIDVFTNNILEISMYLDSIIAVNKKIQIPSEESEVFYCELSGHIRNIDYIKEETFIFENRDKLIFISKKTKNIINEITIQDSLKLSLNEEIIIYDGINLFNMSNISDDVNIKYIINSIKDIDEKSVGYTINHAPFLIEHNRQGLTLLKSAEKEIITIGNELIKDIVINNQKESENINFTEVEIKFLDKVLIVNISIPLVQSIIRNVFIYSEQENIKNKSVKELYKDWAKSMKNTIIFNFFGDLDYIKIEIDRLINKPKNKNISTRQEKIAIVNMLYYMVQNQKNKLDVLCAYMPKMMEVSDSIFFENFDIVVDKKVFKFLQKQLFAISRQLNRYLNDIEKSLHQITFAIYDEFSEDDFPGKIDLEELSLGMGILPLTINLPNIANKSIEIYESKSKDEIDDSKLTLFTDQAINKMNHLIKTMYPYYIEEANTSLTNVFNNLEREYSKFEENEEVKEIIFDRITDLYVYEQLTLNSATELRRKDIISKLIISKEAEFEEIF